MSSIPKFSSRNTQGKFRRKLLLGDLSHDVCLKPLWALPLLGHSSWALEYLLLENAFPDGERLCDLFVICVLSKVVFVSMSLHESSEANEERIPELLVLIPPFSDLLHDV